MSQIFGFYLVIKIVDILKHSFLHFIKQKLRPISLRHGSFHVNQIFCFLFKDHQVRYFSSKHVS